jgi:small subunit ribosomal protein S2
MKELEEIDFDDTTRGYTKKELLIQRRELVKLQRSLGGIRNLTKTPSAIWIVDTKKEHLAIDEAHKLGIPVIAILDTNCDPDEVQYPIPGNDDAIRSVGLLTRIIADAAAEGLIQRHQKAEEGTGNVSAVEPLAEWEAELLGASETPSTEAEKIEAVDGLVTSTESNTEAVAEVIASEVPVEENDADAVAAEHEAAADATIVPEHHVVSDEEAEAKIEAEATAAEKAHHADAKADDKKPAASKPAAAKPAAAKK